MPSPSFLNEIIFYKQKLTLLFSPMTPQTLLQIAKILLQQNTRTSKTKKGVCKRNSHKIKTQFQHRQIGEKPSYI